MSDEVVMTTLQLDQDSKRKLQEISNKTERSMSAMVRWLISQEYDRMSPQKEISPLQIQNKQG